MYFQISQKAFLAALFMEKYCEHHIQQNTEHNVSLRNRTHHSFDALPSSGFHMRRCVLCPGEDSGLDPPGTESSLNSCGYGLE